MYYDVEAWARTKDKYDCVPLCTAAAWSLKWEVMRQIFVANMPAIYEVDWMTGLPLFMLAAVGPYSDVESVYNLLKQDPLAIGSIKKRQQGVDKRMQERLLMAPKAQTVQDDHRRNAMYLPYSV